MKDLKEVVGIENIHHNFLKVTVELLFHFSRKYEISPTPWSIKPYG